MLEGDWVGATSSSLSVNKFCSGICHLNKEHRVISSVDLALVLTCSLCRVRGDKPCNASTCTFEHEESRAMLRNVFWPAFCLLTCTLILSMKRAEPKWQAQISTDQLSPAGTDSSRTCARLCRRLVIIHKYQLSMSDIRKCQAYGRHLSTYPPSDRDKQ